jgi:hypothetical protein
MTAMSFPSSKGLATLLLWTAVVGCSDGGFVPLEGSVSIEGQPVSGGRLSIVPQTGSVGGGKPAAGLVDEQGRFALRTGNDQPGVLPGSYRVLFRQEFSAQDSGSPRGTGNQPAAAEMTLMYQSAKEKPLVVPDAGLQSVAIDIRAADGWKRTVSE